eukprot:CAMPEP_0114524796 /NCGR_PEP_ID=MMETSP0109-20121206/22058_1 /TAXON_ID=29199 /ORGANISM="Chlorarachnion reptans, Strain CCCM449" /LENGTH=251 /DNA_ID=CAMNT_0001706287 /DNA_START=1 /DNA_END=756 /DNA_ORIENTATION=+
MPHRTRPPPAPFGFLSRRILAPCARGFAINRNLIDKTLDVILLDEVKGFGFKGELVNLKRGHARQLIHEQIAVYPSELNQKRFLKEISKEELKAREEKATLKLLRKRFSKLEVKLVRGADKIDPTRHNRGVSLWNIQQYLEKYFNMDVPLDYLFLPGDEPTEGIIVDEAEQQLESKGDEKEKDDGEEREVEIPDDPMIEGNKMHGFGHFEIKVKVAGYLIPLKVKIERFEPPDNYEENAVDAAEAAREAGV